MCLNLYTATGHFVCVLVCYALYRVNMCYLVLTMRRGGVHAFMNCNLRLDWSEEVKPVLFVVRRYV